MNSQQKNRKEERQQVRNELKDEKDGTCPPCPACERCPEPAFTCEKVVNYRSPSVNEYLPVPVLNDFSSFPSS